MKIKLLITLIACLFVLGCASPSKKRVAEWEQSYKDGKLTYFELESLKNQERQRKATVSRAFIK